MSHTSVGPLVRQWRTRRRLSQLELSAASGVSSRHLSFIETGRSTPSRPMIERLCDELDVPLRERNALYLAAGFAPAHHERPLDDLGTMRDVVQIILDGHDPYPAAAVNHRWELLAANRAMSGFLASVPDTLRTPRLNMLRATLHPDGLGPRVRNYEQWRAHTVRRIRRQIERTADATLADLLAEIRNYPAHGSATDEPNEERDDLLVPLVLDTEYGTLSLSYVLSVFGAPRDVTLDEIAIETNFPADEATRELLIAIAM